MIVNNYNNSLPENKRSYINFYDPYSPRLFVRKFPCRINYNEKLVIPYYITPYVLYNYSKTIEEEALIGSFYERKDSTYTTVLVFDCDDESISKVYKQTTFEGINYIELEAGTFTKNDVGEHLFSLECIRDDGNSTVTHYFKIMIDDPGEVKDTIDLSTQVSFSSSFGSNLDSSNKSFKYLSRSNTPYRKVITGDYTVSTEVSDGKVEKINISVASGTKIHYTKVNSVDGDVIDYGNTIEEDISGEYAITTYCVENGRRYNLIDYINKQPSYNMEFKLGTKKADGTYNFTLYDYPYTGTNLATNASTRAFVNNYYIPQCVIDTCIRNKIAITRLMEATKAYSTKKRYKIIMPKEMPIVIDYHSISGVDSDIVFQDFCTLDLNGSIIYSLPTVDSAHGGLVGFNFNYDSHITNGKIYGNYKYLQYENQSITSIMDGSNGTLKVSRLFPEWTGITGAADSSFCTFNNVEIAYATGYEAFLGSDNALTNYSDISFKEEYSPPYNHIGFMDYNGVLVQNEFIDYGWSNKSNKKMLDEDQLKSIYTIRYSKGKGKSLLESSQRASFRSVKNVVCGPIYRLDKTDGASTGMRHKTNKESFVHFFDKDKKFISTIKIDDHNFNVYPKNAYYATLSAFGTLDWHTRPINIDSLTNKSGNGSPIIVVHGVSWCCGYDKCYIRDLRSSMFDNKNAMQCFFTNCYTSDIAIERSNNVYEGGYSNQTQFIDLEDGSITNVNFLIDNCENIYGSGRIGSRVHISYNLMLQNNRGINFLLEKGNYGGIIENCFLPGLSIGHGFPSPIRYEHIDNNIICTFNSRPDFATFALGSSKGETFLRNTTIMDYNNRKDDNGIHRTYPMYVENCNFINKIKY